MTDDQDTVSRSIIVGARRRYLIAAKVVPRGGHRSWEGCVVRPKGSLLGRRDLDDRELLKAVTEVQGQLDELALTLPG